MRSHFGRYFPKAAEVGVTGCQQHPSKAFLVAIEEHDEFARFLDHLAPDQQHSVYATPVDNPPGSPPLVIKNAS